MKLNVILFFLMLGCHVVSAQQQIRPGETWSDSKGEQINAHGGGVIYDSGYYYWFGEDRTGMVSNGVSCYRSKDLYTWERIGLALKTEGQQCEDYQDIAPGRLMERPKVVFNAKDKKWVMWAHWETGDGYGAARVVVAQSDKVEGPYRFYKTFRPNEHDSRDQTLFVDNDGKAYHFGSTDMNTNMNVAQLRDDYLEPNANETKVLNGLMYEAPAIFRKGDVYFGLFSGCTGWDPNPGHVAYTYDILGKWNEGGNFAVDRKKELTYQSQSTYIFKVEGKEDAFVYMGDRWNSSNVGGSHYVWLPISLRSGYPTVRWYDAWDVSIFDEMYRYKRAREVVSGNTYVLLEKQSDRLVSKPTNGFTIEDDNDQINLQLEFVKTGQQGAYKLKDIKSGKYIESVFSTLRLSAESDAKTQEWQFHLQEDGYYKISNAADGKYISVSGSSTFSGINLYLTALSNKVPQDFAVYFDSKKYTYDAVDIFSKEYRAQIAEQLAKKIK